MSEPDYTSLVAGKRAYFLSGKTHPVAWRVEQLNAIRTMLDESRDAIARRSGMTCGATRQTPT